MEEIKGYYDHNNEYGPQVELKTTNQPCRVLISISKKDLRWAVGADKDNRQGIYLMESIGGGKWEQSDMILVESSGDWSKREVSLEAMLKENTTYYVVVLATISNVKFTSVPYTIRIYSECDLQCIEMRKQSKPCMLLKAILQDMSAHMKNHKRLTSEIYSLMHFLFMYDADGKSNRISAMELGALEMLMTAMNSFDSERSLQLIACSVLWNMACSQETRNHMMQSGVLELLEKVRQKFYGDEEFHEVIDAAKRNICMKSAAIAMDPLIEQCILQDACTFSVTGNKTFLLQVWYDCKTCNMRSNYGVCQTCAQVCHKGHELGPPKFARFYCDCGYGEVAKKADAVKACLCVKTESELKLKKKREKDKFYYNPDEKEDPEPKPPVNPKNKKKGVVTLFG